MKILLTGAAGYIGSHVVFELLDRGYTDLCFIDKFLGTSHNWVINKANTAYDGNILSQGALEFLREDYDVIIHLGAYVSGQDNVEATKRMLRHRKNAHFIFASTGEAFNPITAFAQSKRSCEEEIKFQLDDGYTIFRFYNVAGRRPEVSGETHSRHLICRAARAAKGLAIDVPVFGDDWETPDGTCVRDYIDARDLATSIVNAIGAGPANTPYECLGSGTGYSVKEVLDAMKKVTGQDFPVTIIPRRPGDVASIICPEQYKHISLTHDLDAMCLSAYEGLK